MKLYVWGSGLDNQIENDRINIIIFVGAVKSDNVMYFIPYSMLLLLTVWFGVDLSVAKPIFVE